MKTILVTGVTGYIAKHVTLELLNRGYKVRGTLRDKSKGKDLKAMFEEHGCDSTKLEFVELDLLQEGGWAEAMKGVDAVQHLASPFPMEQPEDKMDLVRPARDGALLVLKQARKAGVAKVVMTSSTASINNGYDYEPGRVFTEADWSDSESNEISAYALSKTLAEKAAWDDVTASDGPELATINPTLVVGPLLDAQSGTSVQLIQNMFQGKYPAVPEIMMGIVDVRDVAKAHVNAMESEEANGKRHLLAVDTMLMLDMAKVLKTQFPEYAGKFPKFQAPKFLVHFLALFQKALRGVLPDIGRTYKLDSTRARNELGIDFISAEDALRATGESLKKHDLI